MAILTGLSWSIFNIIFGKVVDIFVIFERIHNNVTNNTSNTISSDDLVQNFMYEIFFYSGFTVALCVWHIIGNFSIIYCFQMFALSRMRVIKKKYFESILKQEIAWIDTKNSGEFASRISR